MPGDLVPFLPRVVRMATPEDVTFSLEYLADVVDHRLERAVERVFLAVDAQTPAWRTEFMGLARADYAAAHVVASLVDDRVYDCNERPVFTVWAAELVRAARL